MCNAKLVEEQSESKIVVACGNADPDATHLCVPMSTLKFVTSLPPSFTDNEGVIELPVANLADLQFARRAPHARPRSCVFCVVLPSVGTLFLLSTSL